MDIVLSLENCNMSQLISILGRRRRSYDSKCSSVVQWLLDAVVLTLRRFLSFLARPSVVFVCRSAVSLAQPLTNASRLCLTRYRGGL